MLKHIVMFKMLPTIDLAGMHLLKDKLDELKNKIPVVRHLETGLNISKSQSAFDLVLVTEFDSEEDLEAYRIHPDHQNIVGRIKTNVAEVKVVDYII